MNKDFRLKLKTLEEDGTFEGYASTFGNVDLDGDRVDPAAFNRTLKNFRGEVPILFDHDPGRPIGVTTEMTTDARGLRIKGRLVLGTAAGREAYELLKARALKGLSIGVQVVKEGWDGGVRVLKELRLHEISLVAIPADPFAEVLSVKHCEHCPNQQHADSPQPATEPPVKKALPEEALAAPDSDPEFLHSLARYTAALMSLATTCQEVGHHG